MKKRHYNNGDVEFILESTILGYDPDDSHPEAHAATLRLKTQ